MALTGEININVGKYKSDKLALAIKALSRALERAIEHDLDNKVKEKLTEIEIMIKEIYIVLKDGESSREELISI